MKIHIMHCGTVSLPRSAPGKLPVKSLSNDARRVTLPVCTYLIEHPRGLVLVDTGWCREVSPEGMYSPAAARNVLGAPLAAFYRPELKPGQAIHEQLAARGIRPEDLELVIITHLDPDHVSGVKHLKGAKRIIMPEDEYF